MGINFRAVEKSNDRTPFLMNDFHKCVMILIPTSGRTIYLDQ